MVLFIFPFKIHAAVESSLSKDCKEVGNYIGSNAHLVYDALYVKYNGYHEIKKETYELDFPQYLPHLQNETFDKRLAFYKDEMGLYLKEYTTDEKIKYYDRVQKSYPSKKYRFQNRAFKSLFAKKFCKEVIPYKYECKDELKKVIDYVARKQFKTSTGGGVSSLLPREMKAVLTDSTYLPGLINSLEILGKVKPEDTKGASLHNILDQGFSYIDKNKRHEYLWNIIGFYSTRGASITNYSHVFDETVWLPLTLMSEIANRIHYLNWKKSSGESLVTMPKFSKNSCVYGKDYHFWMAARLANKLKYQDKLSTKDAFSTAYMTGLMYNFFGSGADQRNNKQLEGKTDTIYIKSLRHSLLFQTLGAYYGATGNFPDSINLDVDKFYDEMNANVKPIKKYKKRKWKAMKNLRPFLTLTGGDVPYKTLLKKIENTK